MRLFFYGPGTCSGIPQGSCQISRPKKIVQEILSAADIEISGKRPWDMQIKDDRFYERVLRNSSLVLGDPPPELR
jgi:hypothetical protein